VSRKKEKREKPATIAAALASAIQAEASALRLKGERSRTELDDTIADDLSVLAWRLRDALTRRAQAIGLLGTCAKCQEACAAGESDCLNHPSEDEGTEP
jgi:hypothetical protein